MSRIFHEVAVLPHVFDSTSYAHAYIEDLAFKEAELLLCGAVGLRSLCGAAWLNAAQRCAGQSKRWHEFHKAIVMDRLLTEDLRAPHDAAATDWSAEADRSHQDQPLACVVVSGEAPPTSELQRHSILNLRCAGLDPASNPDFENRLHLNREAFERKFEGVFRLYDEISIIDPYLDPSQSGYDGLCEALMNLSTQRKSGAGIITVRLHRNEQGDRDTATNWKDHWRSVFKGKWGTRFERARMKGVVRLWSPTRSRDRADRPQKLHDRFILTRKLGVLVGDSLRLAEASSTNGRTTICAPISNRTLGDLHKEFNDAFPSNRLAYKGEFAFGAGERNT